MKQRAIGRPRGGAALTAALLPFALASAPAHADERETTYREPPDEIVDIVDAPVPPRVRASPDRSALLVAERPPLRTIADLAAPSERLAGIRFNPRNSGPDQPSYYIDLAIVPVDRRAREGGDGAREPRRTFWRRARGSDAAPPLARAPRARPVRGLPERPRIRNVQWSPSGDHIAFVHIGDDRVSLWLADADTRRAREIEGLDVNATLPGRPFRWAPASDHLWVRAAVPDRGAAPERDHIPTGPRVRETRGREAPARTYQDLLESERDAALFDHYATGQLARVDLDGRVRAVGEPGVYTGFRPAPGGEHWLVTEIRRPYSYSVPYTRFPRAIDVWGARGDRRARIADRPLADDLPVAFDATVTGPRHVAWRPDREAELVWAETRDGGDPAEDVEVRERVYAQAAPFEDEPRLLAELEDRFRRIRFAEGGLALVYERWWNTRRETLWRIAPDDPGAGKSEIWTRSTEDRYGDPGTPLSLPDGRGFRRVIVDDGALLLAGAGASDEGDRPFLDRLDLETLETERLWRSEAPHYERVFALAGEEATSVITMRERAKEPPNLYLRDLEGGHVAPLTSFPHPMPDLRGVSREMITYEREDGLPLSARLLLPPGYDPAEDGPLPTVVWAYPREFRSADAAGQLRGSPHEFNRIRYWRPQYLVTQGYAVIDRATMPIVGEGEDEPNDTFIDQLVMNAEAAIAAGAERGVTDPERVAVGGHSYGAFMTANLLAHSELFRAGVARSGAYNRTLTPFGFQREQRTLFEAPELYVGMSPFFHADQIEAPLLLIHGEEDPNSGTYPMQSERLYSALKGLGGTARLVMLPEESHGYRARESILHMLAEELAWLSEFVRDAPR